MFEFIILSWTFSDCKKEFRSTKYSLGRVCRMKQKVIQEFYRILEKLTESQLVKMLAF